MLLLPMIVAVATTLVYLTSDEPPLRKVLAAGLTGGALLLEFFMPSVRPAPLVMLCGVSVWLLIYFKVR